MGMVSDGAVRAGLADVDPALLRNSQTAHRAWPTACAAVAVATTAIALRTWGLGATFASSDQAALPFLVGHSYGFRWMLAHDYGPIVALLQRAWAEAITHLHLPITEAAFRLPVVLISLAQIAWTYPLLRRLRCTPAEAALGMVCCVVLPTLVTDAHYPWAYLSCWLFFGTVALWATLAWFDDRKGWQLALGSLALVAHCLTNCYAFALPLTLLVAWRAAVLPKAARTLNGKAVTLRWAFVGFVVPCMTALTFIAVSWLGTGAGQLGRLLHKYQQGTGGWEPSHLGQWVDTWLSQFGYLAGPIAAAGMLVSLMWLSRGERKGLLGLWAWAAALPLLLATDPASIGHPGAYLIEAVYAGGLLSVLLVCEAHRRLGRRRWMRGLVAAVGALSLAHMLVGSADDCLAGGGLRRWTGVHTGWGNVQPDTGIKAAGWYVRAHVPLDATVLCLHTNSGMEAPVAEYYTGRRVLAGYDHRPDMLKPLLETIHPVADVIVTPEQFRPQVASLPAFARVCELTRAGRPVRSIYARIELALPCITGDVGAFNARYDRKHAARHIPLPLPAGSDMDGKLYLYQEAVRRIKHPPNQTTEEEKKVCRTPPDSAPSG